jgi:hypothetical protein
LPWRARFRAAAVAGTSRRRDEQPRTERDNRLALAPSAGQPAAPNIGDPGDQLRHPEINPAILRELTATQIAVHP